MIFDSAKHENKELPTKAKERYSAPLYFEEYYRYDHTGSSLNRLLRSSPTTKDHHILLASIQLLYVKSSRFIVCKYSTAALARMYMIMECFFWRIIVFIRSVFSRSCSSTHTSCVLDPRSPTKKDTHNFFNSRFMVKGFKTNQLQNSTTPVVHIA